MKKLSFLFFIFSSLFGISQQYKVYIVDEKQEPIPFVSVEINYILNGNTESKQTSGNIEGIILVDTTWKEVKLKLKHVNYQSKNVQVSATNNKVILYSDNVDLPTFVVTGQYGPNLDENSVHKIKVIDSKRIEAQGAVNLQELMEQEMNVRVSQDQQLGSSMSVQGLSGENVKILIDGVPVTGRLNGNIDLSQINLNNIERVEIVEGPLSVNYGTNALAGTINLITKKNKKKFGVSGDAYYETIGQYNVNASVDFAIKSHAFSFSGGRNFFQGYSEVDTSRVDQWRPKEQIFGAFKYSNTIKKLTYQLYSDIFREKLIARGEPRGSYKETAFDDYFYTTRNSNSLNLNYKLNKKGTINILGGYNYYKREKKKYLKNLVTLTYDYLDDPTLQDTSVFDLVFSRGSYSFTKDSSKINFQLGYDINVEKNKGKRIENGQKMIGDYAVFGSLEYQATTKLVIRPGLRYSYNTAYKTPLIPSINAKYSWSKHMSTRFSWGRGFRAPSLKELHFLFVDLNHNIQGNNQLNAESSDNLMLQLNYKRGIKRGVYHFNLSGFYNSVNNQISLALLDASQQLYTYVNIGKFYSQGLNFNSGFKYKTYRTDIGFSWIGRYNIDSEIFTEIEKFSYTPEIMVSFGYEVESWNTVFNLFYKYSGNVLGYGKDEFGNVNQYKIEDYSMMDASIVKYFFDKKLNITLGAKNIFDVSNITSNNIVNGIHSSGGSSIPVAWGRTFFTKVTFNL